MGMVLFPNQAYFKVLDSRMSRQPIAYVTRRETFSACHRLNRIVTPT